MSNKEKFENAPEEYRAAELLPDIVDLIARARERRNVVTKKRVDEIIKYQNEDPEKCRAFIGWRYLGTHNYLEVFGREAETDRLIKKQTKEIQQLRETIRELNENIKDLSQQLTEARTIRPEMDLKTAGELYRVM